jgi:hypothetical protein
MAAAAKGGAVTEVDLVKLGFALMLRAPGSTSRALSDVPRVALKISKEVKP